MTGRWFAEPGADPRDVGGKAHGLARLASAGLPVPPAFVVTGALARGWLADAPPFPDDVAGPGALERLRHIDDHVARATFPAGFVAALHERLAATGATRFSVRSSFSDEDAAFALAAGVYESRVDVDVRGVADAIRAVIRSAISAGAVAYARAHGGDQDARVLAVLIHPYERGRAHGHAAWAAGHADATWDVRSGEIDDRDRQRLRSGLQTLGDAYGAVEVEWVALETDRVRFLQLRPWQPVAIEPWAGWDDLPAGEDATRWRWDAAHNPAPLSAAQAGLVEFVDERCRIGIRQRVLGGYLFYRDDDGGFVTPSPAQARRALDVLAADADRSLAELGPTPALEAALTLFARIYEPLLGPIGSSVRTARRALVRSLADAGIAAAPSVAGRLLVGVPSAASRRVRALAAISSAVGAQERAAAIADYLRDFGDESDAWDVAVPTWRERPDEIVGTASPAPVPDEPPPMASVAATFADALLATAIGEDDDALYAKLQAAVRRALLAVGARAVAAGVLDRPDDVFDWPLSITRAYAAGGPVPAHSAAMAVAGRAARLAAASRPPPAPPSLTGASRGAGTAGRIVGRVVTRAADSRDDAVLVTRTLLPTMLPLVRAAAIVTEVGGPLDHVSAQARERGLPAVVGVAGACQRLPEGSLVLVDADAGLVVRLDEP